MKLSISRFGIIRFLLCLIPSLPSIAAVENSESNISAEQQLNLNPQIDISQGKLKGKVLTSRDGRPYLAFLGIPYGSSKRFQNPQPPGNWEGVYDATEMSKPCAQSMWVTLEQSGEEDCLRLNLYSPNATGKYPVMIYFHGGGFTIGTANSFHANYFMDEDIVLVIVNYRLGPFGFLSTSDDVIPGNFGLKDQTMAMRWVQENIEKFGGDPEKVTLFGGSAGGAAVNFHMLSPLSTGLFHAGLSQSGTSLCSWALSVKPAEMARKFGKVLNCSVHSSQALLDCLLKKSTSEILSGMGHLVEWGYDPFTPFGPTIESENNLESFLIDDPRALLKSGNINKVPWMTGLTEDEGILMHSAFILADKNLTEDLANNWKRIFPITLEYNEVYTNWSRTKQDVVSEAVYNYYFGSKTIGEETRKELCDMFSDRLFNCGFKEAAILAAKHIPVYPYIFAHNRGDFSILRFLGLNGNYGVSHADELSFLFNSPYDLDSEFKEGSPSEQVSKNLVKLWASFAQNGKPTHQWTSTTSFTEIWQAIAAVKMNGPHHLQYYRLDTETSVIPEPFTTRLEFWAKLINQKDGGEESSKKSQESLNNIMIEKSKDKSEL